MAANRPHGQTIASMRLRVAAAISAGVTLQSTRDWVIRYNKRGVYSLCSAPCCGLSGRLTKSLGRRIRVMLGQKWVAFGGKRP
ncbi:MAG: hypothetical protein OXB95_01255 [Rhodobacteraceae bacterium]|nr:hypothetical protein [Paracoccaceae bacterium]